MREVDGMGGHTRSAHDCDGTPESCLGRCPIPVHCGPVTPEVSNADESRAEERVRYALSVERRAFAMGAPMMLLHGTADAIEAMCEDVSRLRVEVERLTAQLAAAEARAARLEEALEGLYGTVAGLVKWERRWPRILHLAKTALNPEGGEDAEAT